MDPAHALVKALGLTLGPRVRAWMQRFPDPNTPAFIEARDEMFRDWLVEVANQTQARLDDQQGRIVNLEARLDEREADVVTLRVHAKYARAADLESDDERRRMLAFADAALVDTTMTLPQHSRAQRIIQELDPADALWLSVLDKVTSVRLGDKLLPHEDHVRWVVWRDRHSRRMPCSQRPSPVRTRAPASN
jgi:hypothetical protein